MGRTVPRGLQSREAELGLRVSLGGGSICQSSPSADKLLLHPCDTSEWSTSRSSAFFEGRVWAICGGHHVVVAYMGCLRPSQNQLVQGTSAWPTPFFLGSMGEGGHTAPCAGQEARDWLWRKWWWIWRMGHCLKGSSRWGGGRSGKQSCGERSPPCPITHPVNN